MCGAIVDLRLPHTVSARRMASLLNKSLRWVPASAKLRAGPLRALRGLHPRLSPRQIMERTDVIGPACNAAEPGLRLAALTQPHGGLRT